MSTPTNTPETFWARVERGQDSDCWPWRGTRRDDGRGVLSYQGKRFKAHRLAFELTNGTIPRDMCVLHRCDNPPCCNPSHLFLGTKGDNNRDCASKGRRRGYHKLSPADVIAIRNSNKPTREVAADFNITPEQVRNIVTFKQWRHVA